MERVEHEPNVLQARQVGRHDDVELIGVIEDRERQVAEALVDVDDHVVVHRPERL